MIGNPELFCRSFLRASLCRGRHEETQWVDAFADTKSFDILPNPLRCLASMLMLMFIRFRIQHAVHSVSCLGFKGFFKNMLLPLNGFIVRIVEISLHSCIVYSTGLAAMPTTVTLVILISYQH